ncbi:MAG: septum formation protein Maf [Alphaproteobacteria bacterium]|nr:MAG: septum formation protein Maf [Alphaproteobacteria bacterium]
MARKLILASTSPIRAQLLRNAGLTFESRPARVDEPALRAALEAEAAKPRDVVDTLAEMKARRVAANAPEALVLGCDQIAELDGRILAKPSTPDEARAQLSDLSGKTHRLLSAAVVYDGAQPVWRHVGVVRLTMHELSPGFIKDYVARNWPGIGESVGGYKIEEEGVRLFSKIEGDFFHILGLPLTEFLSFLVTRGELPI